MALTPQLLNNWSLYIEFGVPFYLQMEASQGPILEWRLEVPDGNQEPPFVPGQLPPGLTFNTTTGVISGTPTTKSSLHTGFSVRIGARNAAGWGSGTQNLTIRPVAEPPVEPPPIEPPVPPFPLPPPPPPPPQRITSPLQICPVGVLKTSVCGDYYEAEVHYQIAADNNPTSFAADLPRGLTIDTTTGVISGVVTGALKTTIIRVTVTAFGPVTTARDTLQITICEDIPIGWKPRAHITSPLWVTAVWGEPFSYQIEADNVPTAFAARNLPPALTASEITGIISGRALREIGAIIPVTITGTGRGLGPLTTATDVLRIVIVAPAYTPSVLPDPCPRPKCIPCPHPPIEPDQSGPDVRGVHCWVPEGCCPPSPCNLKLDDFICQLRTLLPEGDIYNNTRHPIGAVLHNYGVTRIGCARIGCEQLIFGGCCDESVFCSDTPPAPQLAVIDSYAAVVYGVIQALCDMLKELDPCTSEKTQQTWARKYGIVSDNLCAPQWPDHVIQQLICIIPTLKDTIWTWEAIKKLANRFGADIIMRSAGDFSEAQALGWWTMARDRPADCPPIWPELPACPPQDYVHAPPMIAMEGPCHDLPESFNLIICQAPIRFDVHCDMSKREVIQPHDPDMYRALKWLLPQILPQPVHWCVYECDEDNCITMELECEEKCFPPNQARVGLFKVGCEQVVTSTNPVGSTTLTQGVAGMSCGIVGPAPEDKS